MRIWTAHLHPSAAPVLIPEAFSPGALLFGPLWLLLRRAWIPAILALAANLLASILLPRPLSLATHAALALLLGLIGHDLRRWAVARRGFRMEHVIAARSEPEAWARLIDHRPHLADRLLRRETRP